MKYQEGTFGYWWTVKRGNDDIEDRVYKGNINCSSQNLTSLEGSPKIVQGNFICAFNKLKTLHHAPEKVDKNFECEYNDLTTLEGSPKIVKGSFYCNKNEGLKTLEGAPEKVGSILWCHNNLLKSLKGIPKVVKKVVCGSNPNLRSIIEIIDIFDSKIDTIESNIITNEEYHEYQKLYQKLGRSKFLKLLKLKDLVK